MLKPLTVWITTNWKILQEMGIPHHPTCFLRNLYAGQEAIVRTVHGTIDWLWTGGESEHIHPFASTPVSSLPGLTKSRLPEQERGYLPVDTQEPILTMALLALRSSWITNLGPEIANDL